MVNLVYSLVMIASWLFFYLTLNYYFKLKRWEKGIFLIIIILSLLGETFTLNLYNRFFYYDKILHFFNPFLISFIIIYRLKDNGLTKYTYFFTVLIVVGIGGIAEIYEWVNDIFLNNFMQGVVDVQYRLLMDRMQDTMLDLIFNLIGSVSSCLIIFKTERFK